MDRYGEHSFLYQYGMTGKFPSWKSSLFPPFMPLSAGEESSYNKENRKLSFPSMAAQEKEMGPAPPVEEQTRLLSFLSASACSIQRIPVNKGEKL